MSPKPSTHKQALCPEPNTGRGHGVDAGDDFADFYRREHEGQVRRAYLLLGGATAAHDVVAEAFTAVFARWSDIEEPGPYLNRCVLNGCRDHRRRSPREQSVDDGGEDGSRRDDVDRIAEGLALGAGRLDDAFDEADALAEQLLLLPFRQRAAIVLRFYGGYGEEAIAEQLGCRPGTVGSLIHRGLRHLRKNLGDSQGDER